MPSIRSIASSSFLRPIRVTIYKLLRSVIPSQYKPGTRLEYLVRKKTGHRIHSGRFAGVKYAAKSVGSAYLPKLLGTYELELHPVIEAIQKDSFELLVNIGAGEGYYAIGLAKTMPRLKIAAFERDVRGQEELASMAVLNDIKNGRLTISGNCTATDLLACLGAPSKALVICDIEGGERELLDTFECPKLKNIHILVELHEFATKGVSETLRTRFQATHAIEQIWERERTPADFPLSSPYIFCLPNYCLVDALSEWRPERMSWFWMVPFVSPPQQTAAST
jgi:hypothetical protein